VPINGSNESIRCARHPAYFLLRFSAMTKLCIFVGMTVGSFVGYIVPSSWGIMWAFFISGIGSIVGVYYGWKIGRHFDR
jgi:membrane protein YqaA with SNARE-associated domain